MNLIVILLSIPRITELAESHKEINIHWWWLCKERKGVTCYHLGLLFDVVSFTVNISSFLEDFRAKIA